MLGSNMSLQVIRPSEHAMTQFAFDVWFFVGLLVSNKLVLIFVPVKKKDYVISNESVDNQEDWEHFLKSGI